MDTRVAPGTPGLSGSSAVLVSSLPLGIFSFVFLVTTFAVGLPLSLVWLGIPVLMAFLAGSRGLADLERIRVRAWLGRPVPRPYRPLPTTGFRARWLTRARDAQTWRDVTYLVLLLPLGVVEFTVMVTFWALALGLVALPVYYRFLPDGLYAFPGHDVRWIVVDSVPTALPWAVLGVLLVCLAVPLTRGVGAGHARLAAALLGPSPRRERAAEAAPPVPTSREAASRDRAPTDAASGDAAGSTSTVAG
ncbi:hypothetical protein BJF85_16265 [Saccharomonospora sp. CUA-673]|uniref:sensor domain-containing protein n=1 Tax=Saccharomonospora sp. CUA-673 TaxID=1904969 RepID=UPI00096136F8|nr:sensor domain-containing protein [Saccharomonospora sp. CUA-673]OLT46595.1 hypothetical protein BJF85_16265 [Saccharomonospora sp. CUA-673]